MGYMYSASDCFSELAAGAASKEHAKRQIDENFAEIERLADDLMETEYLLKAYPNPATDHLLIERIEAKRNLMRLLVGRNEVLDGCIATFDKFTQASRKILD